MLERVVYVKIAKGFFFSGLFFFSEAKISLLGKPSWQPLTLPLFKIILVVRLRFAHIKLAHVHSPFPFAVAKVENSCSCRKYFPRDVNSDA